MPRQSTRQELYDELDFVAFQIAAMRQKNVIAHFNDNLEDESSLDNSLEPIIITPPSPISPILPSDLDSRSLSSLNSSDSFHDQDVHYCRLLDVIQALRDEMMCARVLNQLVEQPLCVLQLHLLEHFAEFRPHLFHKKLRVDPNVFDCILDQISDHAIFQSKSNNLQLPVAVQLAIFLNRAGHYGNAISSEDVAQWAGVSVGSVINCTHWVMVAILDQHDKFIGIPCTTSKDAKEAREYVEERTCPGWRNGIFVADGSTINLFEKPSIYGETFYDRKSRYSLNCQVGLTCCHVSVNSPGTVDHYAP